MFKTYKMLLLKRISWTHAKFIQFSIFNKLMETMFDYLADELVKCANNS